MKRVYDMGTDGGGYRTELRIDSGGEIVDEGRTFGSIPNYKPETYRRVSKASPEQLAALRSEIESLVRSSNGDAGTLGQWSITLNTDGQERSFGSADKTFTGAAGPLGAALEKISPWRPWLASVKGSGAGKAP